MRRRSTSPSRVRGQQSVCDAARALHSNARLAMRQGGCRWGRADSCKDTNQCVWDATGNTLASVCFLSRDSLHSRTLLLPAERAWQHTQALPARGGAEQDVLDILEVARARATFTVRLTPTQARLKERLCDDATCANCFRHCSLLCKAAPACACARAAIFGNASGILPASLQRGWDALRAGIYWVACS